MKLQHLHRPRTAGCRRKNTGRCPPHTRRFRPAIEMLEDRAVPTTGLAAFLLILEAEALEGDTAPVFFKLSDGEGGPVLLDGPTSVGVRTRDGTATAPADYKSFTGVVTIPPGQSEATLPLQTYRDSDLEDDESFFLEITSIFGPPGVFFFAGSPAKITIHNTTVLSVHPHSTTIRENLKTEDFFAYGSPPLDGGPDYGPDGVPGTADDQAQPVSASWSVNGNIGTVSPTTGTSTTLQPVLPPGSQSETGAVVAQVGNWTAAATVTVLRKSPPLANPGGPYSVNEGGTVQLHGRAFDVDGTIVDYKWDLDADGVFGETGAAAERGDEVGPTPIFSAAGLDGLALDFGRPVELEVTDNDGLKGRGTAFVTILNVAPTAILRGPRFASAGKPVIFILEARDPSVVDQNANFTFTFNPGDGSAPITVVGPSGITVTHIYTVPMPGPYPVTLTATDKDGATSDPVTQSIRVLEPGVGIDEDPDHPFHFLFAFPNSYFTDENTPVGGDVTANDSDLAGHQLRVTSVTEAFTVNIPPGGSDTLPLLQGGQVTMGSSGDFVFDPLGDFQWLSQGQSTFVSFVYDVTDDEGLTSFAQVTITVTGVDVGLLLNEVNVNPPGAVDPPYEYIELRGPSGMNLRQIYVVSVEGDAGENPGSADLVFDLSGQRLGSNGLLVITGTRGGFDIAPATTVVRSPLLNGSLENDSNSFVVIYSPLPLEQGADLDANDDGVLELPNGAVLLDGIGWTDAGAGDVAYGAILTQSPNMRGAATRSVDNLTPLSDEAWYYGDLCGQRNDARVYDPAASSAHLPLGAGLTPGDHNIPPGLPCHEVIQVEISLRGGINVGSKGAIAVSILTTANFNAAWVDATTVRFAGATAFRSNLEDVDGDGDLDMVLHFRTQETDLRERYAELLAVDLADGILDSTRQSASVSLTGATLDGNALEGFGAIDLLLSGKELRAMLAALATQ